MEKLIKTIPNIRVDEETKHALTEIARKKHRSQTELVRIILAISAKAYKENGILPDESILIK